VDLSNTRFFEYLPKVILPATLSTIKMLFMTTILSILVGVMLGGIIVLTNPSGLKPNKIIYKTIDAFTNIIRSFPIIILIVALIPLTKMIVGTSVGDNAAIFPMTLASIPYVIRMVENALLGVDEQLILAAKSFGASTLQIVVRVMFVEALPSLIASLTMLTITILGTTTIAGAVGAGGLGTVALTYGYQRFDDIIMYSIVVLLLGIVIIIQTLGRFLYNKIK
jgi:D-methionine transport system permease protein